jgi:hypothetical protein
MTGLLFFSLGSHGWGSGGRRGPPVRPGATSPTGTWPTSCGCSVTSKNRKALRPDGTPARRAFIARSLVSAVHGIVSLGLEEKLQLVPLPALREQVTLLVTALGKGLAES